MPGRRARILFFDDRHYAAQGAQQVLTQIAGFSQDAGYDVTVASTRRGALLELADARGLPTAELGIPLVLDQWGGPLSRRGGLRPSVAVALVRQNLRVAAYVRREGYDVVWAAAMRPVLSLFATSALTRSAVVWHVMSDARFPVFNELASLAAHRIVLIADGLTPAIGRLHATRRIRRRTTTLPPGVALPTSRRSSRDDVARELGLPSSSLSKTWVTSIGGYVPEKGHLDVVNAVGALPNDQQDSLFVLLGGPDGDHEYRGQVVRAAGRCRAEVAVQGWVSDVDQWMQASDIFVLASRREGLPLLLLEAMQRGVVTVSYRVGATPELIDDGHSGLLVDQGSVEGLTAALAAVVGDADRRKGLAIGAGKLVAERHTREAMRATFNRILDETVSGVIGG